jgi:SAM-dependent methyltransferase
MPIDIRDDTARYYDANPAPLDDLPFYERHVLSPDAAVLELGCGTGRVLVPLARSCGYIHGIDISEAMIAIWKLAEAGLPLGKARAEVGDITGFDLKRQFDLITAPYRTFQNLETDVEVNGFFACVRRHLAPGGSCILNVFKPKWDREGMLRNWPADVRDPNEVENLNWEAAIEGGRVTCHDRRRRVGPEKLVLYPELVYRRYEGDTLVDEAVLKILMRCYYPDEFEQLVVDHGFEITGRWGGYAGEPYGEGPELVLQFADPG